MTHPPLWICLALFFLVGCRRTFERDDAMLAGVNATLADVKEYYREGRVTTIAEGIVVDAVVVAGAAGGNFYRQVILQDGTGGLALMIDEDGDLRTGLREGTRVVLRAGGLRVGGFGGVVRVGMDEGLAPLSIVAAKERLSVLSGVARAVPEAVAPHALRPSHYARLVRVCGVQIEVSDTTGTFADVDGRRARNLDLTDCLGNGLALRTGAYASFAEASPPSGRGCVTGVATAYGKTVQVLPRRRSDIALTGARCDALTVAEAAPPPRQAPVTDDSSVAGGIAETFSDMTERVPFARAGWRNYRAEAPTGAWTSRRFRGNGYVQASAFKDSLPTMEAWLISPRVATASAKTLTFRSAQAYYRHGGLEVLSSADFRAGMLPREANWAPLSARIAGAETDEHEWVESGRVPLPRTGDSLVVAFRYRGGERAKQTTTFRLDDVFVEPH